MEVIKREFLDKPSVSPNGHAERSLLCRLGVNSATHRGQHNRTAKLLSMSEAN